jgi:uncharacterized membrane protein
VTIFHIVSPAIRINRCGLVTDLYIFVESMDSALEGSLFENSFHYTQFNPDSLAGPRHPLTLFASHFSPVLFLLIPFYALFPYALTLFVIQAVSIGSGVIAVFLIARTVLKNDLYGLLSAVIYAVYPTVVASSSYFVPEIMAVGFFLWALFFWIKRKYPPAVIFLLLTLATKELMALLIFAFGIFVLIYDRKYDRKSTRKNILGPLIMAGSLIYLFASLIWIIPAFAGENYIFFGHYKHFGDSPREAVETVIREPRVLLEFIFSNSTLKYLLRILRPVCFLPVLGIKVMIANIPIFFQNALVATPNVFTPIRDITMHWSAPLVPFTMVAVVDGVRFLQRHIRKLFVIAVLSAAIVLSLHYSYRFLRNMLWENPAAQAAVDRFYKEVPEGARVSTNVPFLGWTRKRSDYELNLYFPQDIEWADYVFVWLSTHKTSINLEEEDASTGRMLDPNIVTREYFGRIAGNSENELIAEIDDPETNQRFVIYKLAENPLKRQ